MGRYFDDGDYDNDELTRRGKKKIKHRQRGNARRQDKDSFRNFGVNDFRQIDDENDYRKAS